MRKLQVCVMVIACGAFWGCGGGGGGGPSSVTSPDASSSGTAVIGPEGGTLTVTDPGTPIFGTTLIVPSGALTVPTTISVTAVSTQTLPSFPQDSVSTVVGLEPVIKLSPDNLTFLVPATLTFPYADSNADGIVDGTTIHELAQNLAFIQSGSNEWSHFPFEDGISINPDTNTITVKLDHFTDFRAFLFRYRTEGFTISNPRILRYQISSLPVLVGEQGGSAHAEIEAALEIWDKRLTLVSFQNADTNVDFRFQTGSVSKAKFAAEAKLSLPLLSRTIIFNNQESFERGDRVGAAFDLRSISLHEIGHVLGLGHINNEDCYPPVMDAIAPASTSGSCIPVTNGLFRDDVQRAKKVGYQLVGGLLDDDVTNAPDVTTTMLVITNPKGTQSGKIPISFTLINDSLLLVSVELEYSIDSGNTFSPATIIACEDSSGASAGQLSPQNPNQIADLRTETLEKGGGAYILTWDAIFDLDLDFDSLLPSVQLRLKPLFADGDSELSELFRVNNNPFTDVKVNSRGIFISVFDWIEVDGDQVDLIVNGSLIVADLTLNGLPGDRFQVLLSSGANSVTLHADNQGTSGPNTVGIRITHVAEGAASQEAALTTGENRTFTITAP